MNLYFISNNKKCLDLGDCYTYHKYYYDPQNNECLDTCKGRALNKFQEEFPTTQSTSMECKPQCSGSKKYHNYDSNVCLSKCGADGSNKKYHKYDENICYPSCSDIPNGPYEYEIKDSSNDVYICYDDSSLSDDDTVNCDYYYLKSDGTKKCTDASGCKAKNYIYLLKNTDSTECKDRCDEYYKYETTIGDDIFLSAIFQKVIALKIQQLIKNIII